MTPALTGSNGYDDTANSDIVVITAGMAASRA
jgi:malate/lactate dehydrogenase